MGAAERAKTPSKRTTGRRRGRLPNSRPGTPTAVSSETKDTDSEREGSKDDDRDDDDRDDDDKKDDENSGSSSGHIVRHLRCIFIDIALSILRSTYYVNVVFCC